MAGQRTHDVELEHYKEAFRRIPHPPGGVCTIEDPKINHTDYDDNILRLQDCSYMMGDLEAKCILNRWSATNPVNFASYSTMKNVRQESIVRSENHFLVSTQSRIVHSWIDGTFAAWARQDKYKNCFELSINARGNWLSKTFRQMIVKTSRALEHLFEINLYPKAITIDDIFVCGKASFSVQILVTEANRIFSIWNREQQKKKLRNDIKTIFKNICTESLVFLSGPD